MPGLAAIAVLGLILEDHDLAPLHRIHDTGTYRGTFHGGGPHLNAVCGGNQQHAVQLYDLTRLHAKEFNVEGIAFRYPVLLATCLDDCVHGICLQRSSQQQ